MYVRILLIVVAVVLLIGGFSSHLLYSVVAEKRDFEQAARDWAVANTAITQVDEVYEYRGTTTCTVVIGKNQQGTRAIAWKTKDSTFFDTMDGKLTKESVADAVTKHFPNDQVVHIVPGIEDKKPFWEVVLKNPSGDYTYLYYDFSTGQVTKSFTIHPPAKT
ncbi:cell wall elongation regulator TseB-like domain-containing protein [Brevibacillus fluminis]|uniref:cell wall elongation regulator TseB-like domain-containing protein n=1 Tax=Brevibacillus fluminis TaxID=511487 RepID=UPI003F8BD5D4